MREAAIADHAPDRCLRPGDADQRHTFNAYGQYRLSTRTSLSAKLRMGSNFPIPGYLQEKGADTVEANEQLGFKPEAMAKVLTRRLPD